jgi:hypothetical protein
VDRQNTPMPASDGAAFLLGSGPAPAGGPTSPGPANRRTRRRRQVVILATVVLVLLSAVLSLRFLQPSPGSAAQSPVAAPPPRTNYCTAGAPPSATRAQSTELDPEQAGNAAIIAAVARRRGLPVRATTIALATAFQESTLRNLTYGDADSLGLFQQRPSQGWGTRKQVTDPVHAADAFYDALVKVHGYRTMPITEAAQKVQRSAFPDAYAAYGPAAQAISAALGGSPPARFTCVLPADPAAPQATGRSGVTGRARAVRAAAARETGAGTGRVLSPTTIRFRVPASSGNRRAWALAEWALARADDLDIDEVRVAGQVWNRAQSTHGWSTPPGRRVVGVVIHVT